MENISSICTFLPFTCHGACCVYFSCTYQINLTHLLHLCIKIHTRTIHSLHLHSLNDHAPAQVQPATARQTFRLSPPTTPTPSSPSGLSPSAMNASTQAIYAPHSRTKMFRRKTIKPVPQTHCCCHCCCCFHQADAVLVVAAGRCARGKQPRVKPKKKPMHDTKTLEPSIFAGAAVAADGTVVVLWLLWWW